MKTLVEQIVFRMVNNIVRKISNINSEKDGEDHFSFFSPLLDWPTKMCKNRNCKNGKYFLMKQIIFFQMVFNIMQKNLNEIQIQIRMCKKNG